MKKILIACFCTLWVVRAVGTDGVQPGSIQTLPLGSREAVIAQLGKEVSRFGFAAGDSTTPGYMTGGGWKYTLEEMGPFDTAISTGLVAFLEWRIQPEEAGNTVTFNSLITATLSPGKSLALTPWKVVSFDVVTNEQGVVVFPPVEYFVKYPYDVEWLPVSGALNGVERVDYLIKNSRGGWSHTTQTVNGVYDGCWMTALVTNKCLYLYMGYIEPEMVHSNGLTGEVRLWYSVANGLYESFDIRTGAKIASVLLLQANGVSNDAFCVNITGIPGNTVRMETSTNLKTWTDTGVNISLNAEGRGTFFPDTTKPQLFVRARLLSP